MEFTSDQDRAGAHGGFQAQALLAARGALAGIVLIIWALLPAFLCADPLYSPTWGYTIDLPEGFVLQEKAGNDKYSFGSADGVMFDLAVYPAEAYASVALMADDLQKRLKNSGGIALFDYYGLAAAIVELRFGQFEGWALCVELGPGEPDGTANRTAPALGEAPEGEPPREQRPKLLALAYGARNNARLHPLMFSALDSIAPTSLHSAAPGPVTEFTFPREHKQKAVLSNSGADGGSGGAEAWFYDVDAEAAQALVDREFKVLSRHNPAEDPLWREAWKRFYRLIFRDALDRLADTAEALEKNWGAAEIPANALTWVQSFSYERNTMGSDFVNPVSAAIEGRGDCDSRAVLFAILLSHAGIPAAIMVSREYGHAMGLADIAGEGARFGFEDKQWLVAETTARVGIGLINANTSDPAKWIGVSFY
jgi:hypothetical protein